jgi:hypothetical protein
MISQTFVTIYIIIAVLFLIVYLVINDSSRDRCNKVSPKDENGNLTHLRKAKEDVYSDCRPY